MSRVLRDVPTPFNVCDGCGEDIPANSIVNLHHYEVSVRVRIDKKQASDWWRQFGSPIEAANQQHKDGTATILHVHERCTIPVEKFNAVIEAAKAMDLS